MDIDLVLTGPGALSDGITQGLWEDLLPKHAAAPLPTLDEIFIPGAKMMQENFRPRAGHRGRILALRPAIRIHACTRYGRAEDG